MICTSELVRKVTNAWVQSNGYGSFPVVAFIMALLILKKK